MTKQGIIDLLYNEIGNPNYKTVGDYHKGIADILLTEFEQEKINLLKNFVEWLEEQYKDIYQLYNEEMKEETNYVNCGWFVGRKDGIGEIRRSLKTSIERFLKENEDDTRQDKV